MSNPETLFVGRYQLLRQIGHGGMAVVYLARDVKTQQKVAVKALSNQPVSSDEYRARFRKEAKALCQLSHPNIVRILDYGEVRGRPCMILEWVGGGTLADRMGMPLPISEAAGLILPIAQALQYAHEQGVIHRDVKPGNILLTEQGQPRLTDFGIAKSFIQKPAVDLTDPGTGIGTPEYMAPEQALGQPIDLRVDIYSLGVILFELVTGRKPYTGDTPLGTMMQHTTQPLPRVREFVPDIPEEVERVLFKALAKDPADRYQSMDEFAAVLEKFVLGQKLSTKEAPPLPRNTGKVIIPRPVVVVPQVKLNLPRWALPAGIGALVVVAILAVALLGKLKPQAANANGQLAYITDLSGEVQVDNGDSPVSARRGALMAQSPRTTLKTNLGSAHLGMPDGSLLVMDAQTAIEFGSLNNPQPDKPLAFNLVYGRVLVSNGKENQVAFNALMGGKLIVVGTSAMLGLQAQPPDGSIQDIDCLAGACQVKVGNGYLTINAGQHVRLGKDGIPQQPGSVQYGDWAALGGALVAAISPSNTPTNLPVTATFTLAPSSTLIPTLLATTAMPPATMPPTATMTSSATASQTATAIATSTWVWIPPTKTKRPTATEEPPPPPATATNPPPPPPTATPFPTYTPPPPTEFPTYTVEPPVGG
ncbi:MAG: protein kinase [Anaerolineaceae bacterium]|nr:protein kinase [Anaerolineaceae bacterium]